MLTAIITSCSSPDTHLETNKMTADTLITIDSISNVKTKNETAETEYNPDSTLLEYMNRTYIKRSDTIHLSNKTLEMNNCGWKLNYKGGHFYEDSECQEMGYTVRIKIVGANKSELINLVKQYCLRPNYSWYNDSTEYRPEEYYERVWTFYIIKEKDNYILELATT
jgi:hypothetical protein